MHLRLHLRRPHPSAASARAALAPGPALALAVALAVSACGATTSVATEPPPATVPPVVTAAVHSEGSAAALARHLLTLAVLPPGAVAVAVAPAGLGQPPEQEATPDLAQATTFATDTAPPGAVVAFATAHRPAGSVPGGSGSEGSEGPVGAPAVQFVDDTFAGMPAGVEQAQLFFSVTARSGSGSALRVDAQVAWLPPRPAGTSVPEAATVAVVAVTEDRPDAALPAGAPRTRRVVVTQPATVARLRAAADGLPAASPGVTSCPADLGTRYVVAFATAPTAPPDVTYTAGSCGFVDVARPGQPGVDLGDDAAFAGAYSAVLGLPGGAGAATAPAGG